MARKHGSWRSRGFTLVEILLGMAVISVLSSVGYFTVTNIQEGAKENKLGSDVVSMNAAVTSYVANGGSLPTEGAVADVLAKLKTRANVASAAKSIGMTGSFIDQRIEPEWQTVDEAGTSQLRAVWNVAQGRFVLTREGVAGIKNFRVNNALALEAPTLEARTQNVAGSDVKAGAPVWIWDYADNRASSPDLGAAPTTTAGTAYTPAGSHVTVPLSPPIFGVSGGSRTLAQLASLQNITSSGAFPLIITNPNTGDISHLTTAGVVVVAPSAGGTTISSQAISDDPDDWSDSPVVTNTYSVTALTLAVGIVASSQSVTPFQVGVPPASGVAGTGISVTATITNWATIPSVFRVSTNFQLVMADSTQTLTNLSGSALQQLSGTLTPSSAWSFASGFPAITMNAMARSLNAALFTASPVATATIVSSRPTMGLTFAPVSGSTLNASETITITVSDLTQYPAGYTIRYTTDGSVPSATNGTTYTAAIIPPASGTLTLRAIALPPAIYTNWFNSPVYTATYTVNAPGSATPVGALLAFAELQNSVQFRGNVILSTQATQTNVTFFGTSLIKGNLYVPGTPDIYKSHVASSQWDNQRWSAPVDGNFSNYILGRQFDANGVETTPATIAANPRVVDLNGTTSPSNYYILIQDSAKIEGKIYRRSTPPSLPTVATPGTKNNTNTFRYSGSWDVDPNNPNRLPSLTVNPATRANVDITASNVSVNLTAGNYGNVTVSNNSKIVLGDAANPNSVKNYTFERLNLNGGADLEIVGKVVITVNFSVGNSTVRVDNGGIFGNSLRPDWLQLNIFSSGAASQNQQQFLLAAGSQFYGQIVAPKGLVTLQENSRFTGSISAFKLQMTGAAGADGNINFTLPPITQ